MRRVRHDDISLLAGQAHMHTLEKSRALMLFGSRHCARTGGSLVYYRGLYTMQTLVKVPTGQLLGSGQGEQDVNSNPFEYR